MPDYLFQVFRHFNMILDIILHELRHLQPSMDVHGVSTITYSGYSLSHHQHQQYNMYPLPQPAVWSVDMQGVSLSAATSIDVQGVSLYTASSMEVLAVFNH